MANKDKTRIMVLHEEVVAASSPASPLASSRSPFVFLKPCHVGLGSGTSVTSHEAKKVVKTTPGPPVASSCPLSSVLPSAREKSSSSHLPENLSPEVTCKGVTITLDNNSMWNEFYRCKTEMILTKQGRRMFPYCRFRFSGMEPFQSYVLVMDITPVDNHRYRWSEWTWEPNGKAEPHVSGRVFVHPESPLSGHSWMQSPVSFYKLKVTNNTMDQEGHIILHSMHRYLPRLHVIPADKATDAIQLNRPEVMTFSFPQTEFFAVTSYQNLQITQLKIDYNPFAKGFREDANSTRFLVPKNGSTSGTVDDKAKLSKEANTLKNLKSLFVKRNAAEKDTKAQSLNSAKTFIENVKSDAPTAVNESNENSSKKRPWPGALSQLIQEARVKVTRLNPEDNYLHCKLLPKDISSQDSHSKKPSSSPGLKKRIVAVGKSEVDDEGTSNVTSISESQKSETGKQGLQATSGQAPSENIADSPSDKKTLFNSWQNKIPEQAKSKNTLDPSKSKIQCSSLNQKILESAIDLNTLDPPSDEQIPNHSGNKTLDSLSERKEKGSETTSLPSGPKSKLEDGEGFAKRKSGPHKKADPVPLPLLAHFLKQLKSKTRLTRPKPKAEPASTSDPVDPSEKSLKAELPPQTSNSVPCDAQCLDTLGNSPADPWMSSKIRDTLPSSPLLPTDPKTALSLSITSLPVEPITLSDTCLDSLPANSSLLDKLSKVDSSVTPELLSVTAATPGSMPVSAPERDLSYQSAEALNQAELNSSLDLSADLITATSKDVALSAVISPTGSAPASSLEAVPSSRLGAVSPASPTRFPEPSTVPVGDPRADAVSALLRALTPEETPEEMLPLQDEAPSSPSRASSSLAFSPSPSSPDPDSAYRIPCDELAPGAPRSVDSGTSDVSSAVSAPVPGISQAANQTSRGSKAKSKVRHRKGGKWKVGGCEEVVEGPIAAPLQPNLEDVEGQLFVSFMSQEALVIHLGDKATSEDTTAQSEKISETSERKEPESTDNTEEKIAVLQKALLHDLKLMKYHQVIHPVLQEVGLKLALLDLSLEIDLQYLGVRLPLPPPVPCPGGVLPSSQVRFVSRTGKTTDFTKIKGWRDKFAPSNSTSSQPEGSSGSDAGQKNLSAFCSDMLDEYLASEGKLIDERAASFSQTALLPVSYQLPTRSTSYVRTLDSVLKKQTPAPAPAPAPAFSKPLPFPKKPRPSSGARDTPRSTGGKFKKISSASKPALSSAHTLPPPSADATPSRKKSSAKSKRASKSSQLTDPDSAAAKVPAERGAGAAPPGPGGRGAGLPSTLMKLMDVEDGAVWEGRDRLYVSEERAAIALSALSSAEGTVRGDPASICIMRRRAPPCLNDFCRLGCVCSSLAHQRRHHHCGKPQCMLGCGCLRRKVVVLRSRVKQEEEEGEEAAAPETADESVSERRKKKKKRKKERKEYVLSEPAELVPEPARRVQTLWNRSKTELDPEPLFTPPPALPPSPSHLGMRDKAESHAHLTSPNMGRGEDSLMMEADGRSSMTCARVRPISIKISRTHSLGHGHTEEEQLSPQRAAAAPPSPTKRLEIVSECKWASAARRNFILQILCERMAQNQLAGPFWVGKYHIQPLARGLVRDTGSATLTYKVRISQPEPAGPTGTMEQKGNQRSAEEEEELIRMIGRRKEGGLPLLSRVAPAGLLVAPRRGPITVNGKNYPLAKLELGLMGALHPASRLAAYITGKVLPANQIGTRMVTTVPKSAAEAAPAANAASSAVAVTSASSDATVTSITSASTTALTPSTKSPVCERSVGKVFTQFVLSQLCPPQPKPPVLLFRAPPLPPKPSSSAPAPGRPAVSTATTDVSALVPRTVPAPPSGPAAPGKRTLFVVAPAAPPGGAQVLTQPLAPLLPSGVPGQKVLLQAVKTPSGRTFYRGPDGQLIQLMPLSQFKALKTNVLPAGITAVRVTSPNAPPTAGVSAVKTPPGSSVTMVLDKPLTGPANKMHGSVAVTVNTSSNIPPGPLRPLPVPPVPVQNAGGPAPATPAVDAGDAWTNAGNIVAANKREPTIIRTTVVRGTAPASTLSAAPPGIRVLPRKATIRVSADGSVQNSPDIPLKPWVPVTVPTSEESVSCASAPDQSSVRNSQEDSGEASAAEVVLGDHSYTSGQNQSDAQPGNDITNTQNPPVSATVSDSASSSVFQGSEERRVTEGSEKGGMKGLKKGGMEESEGGGHEETPMEDGEVDSDVTEDSEDMFEYARHPAGSEVDGDEDVLVICDSDEERRHEDKEMVGGAGDEDDGVSSSHEEEDDVDVETVVDSAESAVKPRARAVKHLPKHAQLEKVRREQMRESFRNLQLALCLGVGKATKYQTLHQAWMEIAILKKQQKLLKAQRLLLHRQQAGLLTLIAQSSGKSEGAILWKVQDICRRQSQLEAQTRRDASAGAPDKQGRTATPTSPCPAPRETESPTLHNQPSPAQSKTQSPAPWKTRGPALQPSPDHKPGIQTPTPKPPTPAHGAPPPASAPPRPAREQRERTRPNILSRRRSGEVRSPREVHSHIEVLTPVLNVMVPCITIRDPSQPIDITGVQGRSLTPGVAAVAIAVPTVTGPIQVQKPAGPPALKPVLTPDEEIVLPKITSVVSLGTHAEGPRTAAEEQNKVEDCSPPSGCQDSAAPQEGSTETPTCSAPRTPQEGAGSPAAEPAGGQRGGEADEEGNKDTEDETLMDLLNELVFLNQQLNTDSSSELGGTESSVLETDAMFEEPSGVKRDDERSLSPLFLKLDEDLMTTSPLKEDDAPPMVDDLVKVVFGSEPLPKVGAGSGTAVATNGHGQPGPPCAAAKAGASTQSPPPLQQMKVGGVVLSSDSQESVKEEVKLPWRPMPRLAPLGLKAPGAGQEATLPKAPRLRPRLRPQQPSSNQSDTPPVQITAHTSLDPTNQSVHQP